MTALETPRLNRTGLILKGVLGSQETLCYNPSRNNLNAPTVIEGSGLKRKL
jgi:hypothetical protein